MKSETFKKIFIAIHVFVMIFSCMIFGGCSKQEEPIKFLKADQSADGYATIRLPKNRKLNILLLSDPQTGKYDNYAKIGNSTEKTYNFLEDLLKTVKPDFVFITGNLCKNGYLTGYNYYKEYAELFEKLGIFWSFCLGNYDAEFNMTSKLSTTHSVFFQLTKTNLVKNLSGFPHCLVSVGDCIDYSETAGNYFINIKDDKNRIIKSLVSFDCGYTLDGYSETITDAQIKWFKNHVNALSDKEYGKNRNGKSIKTIALSNIPVPEIEIAYDIINENTDTINENENTEKTYFLYGDLIEKKYIEYANDNDFFNVAKNLNSLEAMFFGHEFNNDLNVIYDGIRLGYIQSCTFAQNYRMDFPNGSPTNNILKPPSYNIVDFKKISEYGDNRGGTLLSVGTETFEAKPVYARQKLSNYDEKYFSISHCIEVCKHNGFTVKQ